MQRGLVSLVCGVVAAGRAFAECGFDWRPGDGVPGVAGTVHALTPWDPDGPGPQPEVLVVGGIFDLAGDILTNNIAYWDGVNWHPLGEGLGDDFQPGVFALAVLNGELIAGGGFDTSEGVPLNGVARWDGASWQPLGAEFDDWVFALAVYNGDLIAGGAFTSTGALSVNHIARWDGLSWHPLGSGVSVDEPPLAEVLSLTTYEGELIVGGRFTSAGGVPTSAVARWDGAQWHSLGGGMDHEESPTGSPWVFSLTIHEGQLVAGGHFTTAGGVSAKNIARWNGAVWQPFGAGLDSDSTIVRALRVWDGSLIAAVTGFGGGIYVWSGTNWSSVGGAGNNTNGAYALAAYDGDLIAGGGFLQMSLSTVFSPSIVPASSVARWDGDNWHALSDGMDGAVFALAHHEERLVAGGLFRHAGEVTAFRAAEWDGTAWHPFAEGFFGPQGSQVNAFTSFNGELFATGRFNSAGGSLLTSRDIAAWNGADWHALMGGGLCCGGGRAMTVYEGDLIVGGGFTSAGGVSIRSIARWNGAQWFPLGGGLSNVVGGQTWVYAVTVHDGDLIAGGWFSFADGAPAKSIARWDGTHWHPLGGGFNGYVYALTTYNGELIAGGSFTQSDGVVIDHVARWDGVSWHPVGEGLGDSGGIYTGHSVQALTLYQGEIIAGGNFTIAGGAPADYLARWDGERWQPLGDGVDDIVHALAVYDGDLVVGGEFFQAGSQVSAYWARWGPLGLRGDADEDDHLTLSDVPFWTECLSGPASVDASALAASPCLCVANTDGDADLDLKDFAAFQVDFGE